MLENKVAVIYGAGDAIGDAVARALAREGACVFLAGRTKGTLDVVAGEIREALEGLRRQWAVELEPHGIRVVTLVNISCGAMVD